MTAGFTVAGILPKPSQPPIKVKEPIRSYQSLRKHRAWPRKTEVFDKMQQAARTQFNQINDNELSPEYDECYSSDSDIFPDGSIPQFGTSMPVSFREKGWKYKARMKKPVWIKYASIPDFRYDTFNIRKIPDYTEEPKDHAAPVCRAPGLKKTCPQGYYCPLNKERGCPYYHSLRMDDVHNDPRFQSLTDEELAIPTKAIDELLKSLAEDASIYFPMESSRTGAGNQRLHEDGSFIDPRRDEEAKEIQRQKNHYFAKLAREKRK